MVGAMLVQNTAWKNVERAIQNLRDAGAALDPHRIAASNERELEELIRPAGYTASKRSGREHLVEYFVERFDGSIDAMRAVPTDVLREELLAVHGVGPETAGFHCLTMQLDKPAMVVDAYNPPRLDAARLIDPDADYHAAGRSRPRRTERTADLQRIPRPSRERRPPLVQKRPPSARAARCENCSRPAVQQC